ncbi:MAG TPA: hypothetical protein DCR55_16075 [Lentisphaeria bacterium]|nr:hypothetical protein [Lentisphaeria bacterium]
MLRFADRLRFVVVMIMGVVTSHAVFFYSLDRQGIVRGGGPRNTNVRLPQTNNDRHGRQNRNCCN